ncbi:MAG: hypothetical protein ACRC33_01425, partial [Gemmataceae bacterium]
VRRGGGFVAPFAVAAEASPRAIDADEPVTLTVVVTAAGPVRAAPGRPDLRAVPAFGRQFFVEDVADEPAGPGRWRWAYRLRPRGAWVREVPGVPFLFYNPDLSPPERGYQLLYTDPIPLTVRPAEKVGPPPDYPPEVTEPASGPGLLARRGPWRVGVAQVLAALVAPPLGCAVWYALWRRLYPDDARAARLRRGRAARRAMDALARSPSQEAVVTALAGYLGERFGAVPPTPTPDEAADVLRRADLPALADRLRAAWARADEARFAAEPAARLSADEARRLVLDIEEAACPPSS